MNVRIVGKYIGYLLVLEAALMLPSILVALLYAEYRGVFAFLLTAALCVVAGGALVLLCRKQAGGMYAREGFVVAGGGWVLISIFGALPFVFSGEIPHFIDALFETVSGFTTTGASILTDVETMSHGMLFWRSFTHWLGGVGVLAFLLALVRAQKGSGFSMHMMRAETPGPQVGKMVPRMHESMRMLFIIYGSLSLINLVLLLVGGMPLFDAFCTMFGTAGTGGFGIKADSMASYSPYLQTVTAIFMMLFGVNFSLYFLVLRRQGKAVLRDEELRLYLGIMLGVTALIVINTLRAFESVGQAIHHVFFTVSSIMTTTGYATVDFDLWPQFSRGLILLLMICGAMAGSTGGGIKISRILILFKGLGGGLNRLLHPHNVRPIRINGKSVDDSVVKNVYFFLCMYGVVGIFSFLLLGLDGMSLETNLSAMLACFNNIGPGLDQVGPTLSFAGYSYFSKVILTFNMLLGRLEIFPLLLLFSPATWRLKS